MRGVWGLSHAKEKEMYCAWCNPSNGGTDGICDACMLLYFGIDPATIHEEIENETTTSEKKEAVQA
jgi:hypothetical protein